MKKKKNFAISAIFSSESYRSPKIPKGDARIKDPFDWDKIPSYFAASFIAFKINIF